MHSFINILLICSLLFSSCKQKLDKSTSVSLKDSVLAEYLQELDSLPYYDTSERNYKVLRALFYNDTNFLKNIRIEIKQEGKYEHEWFELDTCIHQKKLNEMDVDEAYRFIYVPAFCSMSINLTISKKGELAELNFLLYQNKYDTAECRVISTIEKRLTLKQWEEFREMLWRGDVWGLKRENDIHGLDGSYLTFMGYQSGKPWESQGKITYVKRWEYSSLKDAMLYILKISGNKKGCIWVQ